MTSCDEIRGQIGAELLGGLDEHEAHELFEHLATCPDCAAHRTRLARVVRLIDFAGPLGPALLPDGLEDRLLARSAGARPRNSVTAAWWRKPRQRWVVPALAGAAAGIVATLALLFGLGAIGNSAPPTPRATTVELQPTEEAPTAAAVAYVIDLDSTTTLALRAQGLPAPRPGEKYIVWLTDDRRSYSVGEIYPSAGGWATAILRSRARIEPGTSIGILMTPASGEGGSPRLLVEGRVPL